MKKKQILLLGGIVFIIWLTRQKKVVVTTGGNSNDGPLTLPNANTYQSAGANMGAVPYSNPYARMSV